MKGFWKRLYWILKGGIMYRIALYKKKWKK